MTSNKSLSHTWTGTDEDGIEKESATSLKQASAAGYPQAFLAAPCGKHHKRDNWYLERDDQLYTHKNAQGGMISAMR